MHFSDISSLNLREIVPASAGACAVALHPADSQDPDARFPGIHIPDSLAGAVAKRRLHYAAGRHCAAAAMKHIGLVPEAGIPRGRDNLPVWPMGVVGSISHTDDFAWAAVARTDATLGIGIDVERIMDAPRAARLEGLICSPSELELAAARGLARAEFVAIAFSFKESLYKCVFPLVRRFFGYRDATVIEVDPADGRMAARLERDLSTMFPAGTPFYGRFARSHAHVITSLWLPHGAIENAR